MGNTGGESNESWLNGVFELPREPAIVINGLPEMYPSDEAIVPFDTASYGHSPGDSGFGEWLEGREVRKLFGNKYYNGTVTQFDKETGWYRVEYEDGDFEDLEWHELESVLQPLDIAIPLKTLALRITKKNQKPIHKSGRAAAQLQYQKTKVTASKGKHTEAQSSAAMIENSTVVPDSVTPLLPLTDTNHLRHP